MCIAMSQDPRYSVHLIKMVPFQKCRHGCVASPLLRNLNLDTVTIIVIPCIYDGYSQVQL